MVAGFRAMFSMFGLLSVPAASTAGSPTKARGRNFLVECCWPALVVTAARAGPVARAGSARA